MTEQDEKAEMQACLVKYMGPEWAAMPDTVAISFSENMFWRGWKARAVIAREAESDHVTKTTAALLRSLKSE